MAANMEILGITIGDIPKTDDLRHFTSVSSDGEIIVRDILQEIFETAIRKSEEAKEKKLQESTLLEADAGDLIDLTRNYKQEFRTILQNLKCQSHRTNPTSNTSLEDQIKKVIDEIKSLETSVRLNIEEGRCNIDTTDEKSNSVENKPEILDIRTEIKNKVIFTAENTSEEVVLQVVDLQEDDGSEKTSLFNGFPSEEELVDVSLSDDNQEDRPRSAVTFKRSPNIGETSSRYTESRGKLRSLGEGSKKKKNLGQRLWHFIRKTSQPNPCHSVPKKRSTK